MSLYGVMRTSTSGMAAQANRLSSVADNIANANTTGYKRATAEFSSLVLDNSPGSYTPGSVKTVMRYAIGQQGSLLTTSSVTDLAIRGNGFFVVSDPDGTSYLTRAGAFVPDSQGSLVNSSGFYLMGYPIENGEIDSVANGTSGLEVVNLSSLSMRANPTLQGLFRANLPAGAAVVAAADLPGANAAGAQYTAKSSLLAYDNLGNEITLDVYMSKSADGPPPTWEMAVFDRAEAAPGGGFPYASGPLGTPATLEFDPTTGNLTSASPLSIDIPIPNGQTLELDVSQMTQLGADYTVIDAVLDGNAPVDVESVNIANDGTVYAIYETGNQVAAFRVPIASVTSPDNLRQLTGNVFSTGPNSGNVQIGFAGSGDLGIVMSGTLEQSTVDMATELTTMIDAQRGYNANSKVFQTGSELMDVLINLKR